MPRGIPNTRATEAAPALAAPAQAVKRTPGLERRLSPTTLHHIYNFDIQGDGRVREVAVVKMVKNQEGSVVSVHYIDIQLMDNIDKGRIKSAVTNVHADKYQLWDLLSQIKLSNGKNGLDYFHQVTRIVNGPGAVNTAMGGGLATVGVEGNFMVGADFSDPSSGSINSQEA